MRTLLARCLSAVFVLATLYLVPVNVVLNLPATHAYLNRLQPDQFVLDWEYAWSLYPLHVEVASLAADGQTSTDQWQMDARRGAASVSLLPLLAGEVRLHGSDLGDIDLRLRPRPKPGDRRTAFVENFPVIRSRDPDAPAVSLPEAEDGAPVFEIDAPLEVLGDPADEAQADLIVRFDRVQAELKAVGVEREGGPEVLFAGRGLTAQLHAADIDPTTTSSAKRAEELLSEIALKLLRARRHAV